MKAKDLSGQRFGRLVVLYSDLRRKWYCQCDCGNTAIVSAHNLNRTTKPTRSCGCLQKEMLRGRSRTHGLSKTPEFMVWVQAKRRCFNPKERAWKWYGKRGITMHPEWINNFVGFYEHMGPRPSSKHTIERINNDGNYEPGNVKWATQQEQCKNQRHHNKYSLV